MSCWMLGSGDCLGQSPGFLMGHEQKYYCIVCIWKFRSKNTGNLRDSIAIVVSALSVFWRNWVFYLEDYTPLGVLCSSCSSPHRTYGCTPMCGFGWRIFCIWDFRGALLLISLPLCLSLPQCILGSVLAYDMESIFWILALLGQDWRWHWTRSQWHKQDQLLLPN